MFDEIIDKFIVSSPYALRYTNRIFLIGCSDWCDCFENKIKAEIGNDIIIDKGRRISKSNNNSYEIIISDFNNRIDILDALNHLKSNGVLYVLANNSYIDRYNEVFQEVGYPSCICMMPNEHCCWIIYDKSKMNYGYYTRLEWI